MVIMVMVGATSLTKRPRETGEILVLADVRSQETKMDGVGNTGISLPPSGKISILWHFLTTVCYLQMLPQTEFTEILPETCFCFDTKSSYC